MKPEHSSDDQFHSPSPVRSALSAFFRIDLPILGAAFLAAFVHSAGVTPAAAQTAPAFEPPIIQRGDAVVTGFSGVVARKPRPGGKLADRLFIDTQAAALQVFDLSQMFGPDDARLVEAPRLHTVPAGTIGQVFGVTLDDGLPASGRDPVSNIYAAATSAYGLQIVRTRKVANRQIRERAKAGSPEAVWMAGAVRHGRRSGQHLEDRRAHRQVEPVR